MKSKVNTSSLSERMRKIGVDDFDLLEELKGLEKLALAKTIHATANGKTDQFFVYAKRALWIVGVIIAAIFAAGGEWRDITQAIDTIPIMQEDISALREDHKKVLEVGKQMETLSKELKAATEQINRIDRADEYYRKTPIRTPRIEK